MELLINHPYYGSIVLFLGIAGAVFIGGLIATKTAAFEDEDGRIVQPKNKYSFLDLF